MSRINIKDGKADGSLTNYQRNHLYRMAKDIRTQIKERQLTKSEHWNPTRENVQKCIRNENNPQYTALCNSYRAIMNAIGADPKDLSTERLRKGRR